MELRWAAARATWTGMPLVSGCRPVAPRSDPVIEATAEIAGAAEHEGVTQPDSAPLCQLITLQAGACSLSIWTLTCKMFRRPAAACRKRDRDPRGVRGNPTRIRRDRLDQAGSPFSRLEGSPQPCRVTRNLAMASGKEPPAGAGTGSRDDSSPPRNWHWALSGVTTLGSTRTSSARRRNGGISSRGGGGVT